ncbi:gluconolactonase [Gammaproteobacteria bacterium]|nr:gluconolactonase [Gammaproteobacteria bacterium]
MKTTNFHLELFNDNSILECLCSPAIWAEGPVWMPEQQALIFSDVKGNCMYSWQYNGSIDVFRPYSNYANGNARDQEGRLISCEHGRRCISRTQHDGSIEILVTHFDGKRFNSPNDVVVKSDGTIWFTDPPYGIISDDEGYHSPSQIIGCYIYCFDPKENSLQIATCDTQRPNGLAFSPDESLLYVADMSIIDFPTCGRSHLRVYAVDQNNLDFLKVLTDVAPGIPDGFCLDKVGNIFCSCDDGIVIFNPEGQQIGKINVPERVSNCTFGGPNYNELFITATRSLYRIKLATGISIVP